MVERVSLAPADGNLRAKNKWEEIAKKYGKNINHGLLQAYLDEEAFLKACRNFSKQHQVKVDGRDNCWAGGYFQAGDGCFFHEVEPLKPGALSRQRT